MKLSLSDTFTAAGATVAVLTVVALAAGLNIPGPWIVRLVMYKAMFAAAAGLLIAGAFFGRHAKLREREALEEKRAAQLNAGIYVRGGNHQVAEKESV